MQHYIGKTIGTYQIVEQVGRGGMATVFKAYQPSMDRYVAIKILPSHFTEDASFVGRFTQEARTLARLEHPHILPVHDYGEQEGTTYLVMRYVQAGTLKDLVTRGGPMDLEEVARVMGQVGGALDYAHSQDVIHRDIKPSNVLVDERVNTFLTDFGIAKLVAETAQFTASGAVIGTPAYMSPEQGMGQPVDYRCDIYSLGVVLYELVTGRVPYEAETPLAVLMKHVNDPLPLPRQIKPDLPEAVERVILKAMAKAPDHRFQSAQQMVDTLAAAVAGRPAQIATPPSAVTAATVARSVSETPPPVVETPQPMQATPQPQVRQATPAPLVRAASPQVAEPSAPPEPAAQVRKRRPWLLIAGVAALLLIVLAGSAFLVWSLIDGEPTPTPVAAVESPPAGTGPGEPTEPAQPTQSPSGQVEATPPTDVDEPADAPSTVVPAQTQYASGWTNFGNDNFVYTLAHQGEDYLWAGSESGLVRWNLGPGSYTRFGREDGLPSVLINDLLVDQEGNLWAATDAGIARYDGESWTTYDMADGLDSNSITSLFQDELGGLWAGSRGGERGLNFFQGARWGAPPPNFLPPLPVEYPNVTVIGGNEDVGYFVGLEDEGLLYFEGEGWFLLTEADGMPPGGVTEALLTGDSLWVSYEEAVVRFDLETGDWEILPLEYIHTMHEASNGEIWFGGSWRAVRLDPYTGDYEEYDVDTGPIPAWLVTDIVEDAQGLYIATYGGGVTHFDGSNWETWLTDAVLGGNWIEAIRQTGDGALWFVHSGTGLSRYQPQDDAWEVYGELDGAVDWPAYPAVDSNGYLWTGDYGELVYFDGQDWQTFSAPELADESIYGIEIGPGDVMWLATDLGLMRYDPGSGEWTTFTGADHPILDELWTYLAASDGTLWAGGEEGLAHYDGSTWTSPVALGEAPVYVDDLAEGADGSLWIAADGELGHLASSRWTYYPWPSEGWLETIAVAPDGSVWAGYEGLGHFDPASEAWQMYSTEDGLVHQEVHAIHVTPEGVVWVGTAGGVSRLVPTR